MDGLKDDSIYAHWTFAVARAQSQLAYMDDLLQIVSREIAAAREALDQSHALLGAYRAFEPDAPDRILPANALAERPEGWTRS